MKKAVILLSGGMDSSTLLHYAKQTLGVTTIRALSFDYGQKHSRELDMARWQAVALGIEEHTVLDASFLKGLFAGGSALTDDAIPVPELKMLSPDELSQPPTYVPNRNMILLAIAAAHAEATGVADILYGAQAQDEYGYWDCTTDFLTRLNTTLSLNRKTPVTVHAPFIAMKKADILKQGLKLGVDYAHTWSCYCGASKPCGKCPTCVERTAAFAAVGLPDPLLS